MDLSKVISNAIACINRIKLPTKSDKLLVEAYLKRIGQFKLRSRFPLSFRKAAILALRIIPDY